LSRTFSISSHIRLHHASKIARTRKRDSGWRLNTLTRFRARDRRVCVRACVRPQVVDLIRRRIRAPNTYTPNIWYIRMACEWRGQYYTCSSTCVPDSVGDCARARAYFRPVKSGRTPPRDFPTLHLCPIDFVSRRPRHSDKTRRPLRFRESDPRPNNSTFGFS